MKFLVALTYLLVSALTPNAYADLIRGAKKDDGQVSEWISYSSFQY
jgi:hypothetical protein